MKEWIVLWVGVVSLGSLFIWGWMQVGEAYKKGEAENMAMLFIVSQKKDQPINMESK